MSAPFVTFVSTAFKTEQYVPRMIESLLAQTDPDWDLVIVDNGRVDSMADVIGRYASDPRIRMVRQENKGVIGGFAAATAEALGEYVTPLASDDEVLPHYVERMRSVLAEHHDAVAVVSDAELFSDTHEESYKRGWAHSIGSRPPAEPGDWYTTADLFSGRLPFYAGMFLRTVWQETGYSTQDGKVDENIDLLFKVLQRGRIYMVPDRLARYRLRDDSVTRDDATIEAFEDRVIHSYQFFGAQASPGERKLAEATEKRMRYMQSLRRARQTFAAGDPAAARSSAIAAWRQQHTPRAGAIVVLLHTAPGLLQRVHPYKRRFADWMLVNSPLDALRTATRASAGRSRKRVPGEPGSGGPQSS